MGGHLKQVACKPKSFFRLLLGVMVHELRFCGVTGFTGFVVS